MSNITLTIPNDDHIALRAFGKALEEMALAHGAPSTQLQVVNEITMSGEQSEALRERLKEVLGAPRDEIAEQAGINPAVADAYVQGCHDTEARLVEIDTTAEQVESLATNVVDRTVDLPEPTVSDATIDSTGTPWDERIHSTSKALNADGTWRLRRKPKDMDEAEWSELVESVKAELTGATETPLEAYETDDFVKPPVELHIDPALEGADKTVELTIEPPVTPPGDDFHTDAGVVTEQTVAGIPPIPVPPVATGAMLDALAEIPVAPPVTTATLELNLPTPPHTIPVTVEVANDWDFPKLMKFLTERHGRITVEQVNALLAVDGLAALTDLNAHPDKIGPFVARVKAHLGE